MVVHRNGEGKKLDPKGHSGAVSEILFSPENGSSHAVIHLTSMIPGGGLDSEEIHETSDQIFHVFEGTVEVYSHGKLFGTLQEGDALLVKAGDPHCLRNPEETTCVLYVITTPPLN